MPGAAVRRFIEEAVGPQDHPEQATTMNKISGVVYKRSAFELYSESRDPGVRDFMARPGADVKRMERSHRIQKKARARVTAVLDRLDCQVDVLSRGEFKGADGADLVITVGGDGTFLHVSHAVRNVPMVGVNTDPNASVGFFCTATAFNFDWVMRNLENLPRTILHRMEVTVDWAGLGRAGAERCILCARESSGGDPIPVARQRTEPVPEEQRLARLHGGGFDRLDVPGRWGGHPHRRFAYPVHLPERTRRDTGFCWRDHATVSYPGSADFRGWHAGGDRHSSGRGDHPCAADTP